LSGRKTTPFGESLSAASSRRHHRQPLGQTAITQSNSSGTGNIAFQLSSPSTITLSSALGTLNTTGAQVNIIGLGADSLTISGNKAGTVLTINSGTVMLSRATIANRTGTFGGGIVATRMPFSSPTQTHRHFDRSGSQPHREPRSGETRFSTRAATQPTLRRCRCLFSVNPSKAYAANPP